MSIAWTTVKVSSIIAALAFASSTKAEQFSIRCAGDGWYHVTFDDQAMRVIHESPSSNPNMANAYKGRIRSITQSEITYDLLLADREPIRLVWDRTNRIIKGRGSPSTVDYVDCVDVPVRPILSIYDQIAPQD